MPVPLKSLIKWPLRKGHAFLRGGRIAAVRFAANGGVHPSLRRSWLLNQVDWDRVGLAKADFDGLARFTSEGKFEHTRYWIDREDLAWYRQTDPFGSHGDLVERADRILAGSLQLAGAEANVDPVSVPWRRDPATGESIWAGWAATRPRRDLDTRFWIELNLHRHFAPVARAGLISGDGRYDGYLRRQWSRWLRHNPPIDEEYISDGLELALRVLAWTDVLFLRSGSAFPASDVLVLLALVARYGAMIEHQCEGNKNRNNHLAAEAWGLFFIGTMYPELESSSRWRDKGLAVLSEAAAEQFTGAGVHVEQALGYQLFVTELTASALCLANRNRIAVPSVIKDRLSACAAYLSALRRQDGTMPPYGDEGMPFFSPTGETRVRSERVLTLLRSALDGHHPEPAQPWAEESFWLIGRGAWTAAVPGEGANGFDSRSFDDHLILRGKATHVHFDCGAHGLGKRAGHGHDDALSFDYFHDRVAWVSDAGTYTYLRGGRHREYFAGALAHSGVLYNGRGAARMVAQGSFGWLQKADATLVNAGRSAHFCWGVGRHLGCADDKNWFPVIERFLILCDQGVLLVVDICSPERPGTIDSLLHLEPSVMVQSRENGALLRKDDKRLCVLTTASQDQEITVHRGEDPMLPGWHSPDYGVLLPTSVLRIRSRVAGRFWRVTVLIPDVSDQECTLEVSERSPTRLRCWVRTATERNAWELDLAARSVSEAELNPQCQ